MSGFGGILHLNGAPIPPQALEPIARSLEYRAWDGIDRWSSGSLGVVHARFWTTPEDQGEAQPRVSRSGKLLIVTDARVDNREELLPQLVPFLPDAIPTDADVILAAYQAWGERMPERLVGDFAFAIWDREANRLFLARDAMGLRQLYFARRGGEFFFGNTIGAVMAGLGESPALNGAVVQGMLRNFHEACVDQTIYRKIERLPASNFLVIDARQQRRVYYSALVDRRSDTPRERGEWVEEFRHRLETALRCRVRSHGPVMIRCGGGVDSSALSCLAHRMAGEETALPEIRIGATVSSVPGADERRYLDLVEQHCERFTCSRVSVDGYDQAFEIGPTQGYPFDSPEIDLNRGMFLLTTSGPARQGCRVAISGAGSNEVLGHRTYGCPAAVRGVRWRDLPAELPHFRSTWKRGWSSFLYHAYLHPYLPGGWVEWLRQHRRSDVEWPAWVTRTSRQAHGQPLASDYSSPPGLSPSARIIHQFLRSGFEMVRWGIVDTRMAYQGLDFRLPFYDRRLVQLLLAAPAELRSWRGEDRVLLRRAMEGRMPEAIRTRRDKAGPFGVAIRAFRGGGRSQVDQLSVGMRLQALGFVDERLFRSAVERCWAGEDRLFLRIIRTLCLEAWVRTLPDSTGVE